MTQSYTRGPGLLLTAVAGPGSGAARPWKRIWYLVYDSLAGVGAFPGSATYLGDWPDASLPTFDESLSGGAGDMTVRLPRRYGQAGEPYEDSAFAATLALGNRVDVWVADADTLASSSLSTLGTLVYRGTIRGTIGVLAAGEAYTDVTLASLARLPREGVLPADYTGTGTGVAVANTVTGTYLPGLTWSASNPSILLGASISIPWTAGTTVEEVLNQIIQALGQDWIWWVNATGELRFLQQSRGATGPAGASGTSRHVLTQGAEVTDSQLEKVASSCYSVLVVYNDGTAATLRTGTGYTTADPKTAVVARPDIAILADAQAYGDAVLGDLNRVLYRGDLTVRAHAYDPLLGHDAGYQIENINLGDAVRLRVPRVLGTNVYAGYLDFNSTDTVVHGRRYAVYEVGIELDQQQPRIGGHFVRVAAHVEQVAVHG